jgi:hypothetical protein
VWALVSSIAGFVLCPVVLHVVGLVLASQSLSTIRANPGQFAGDGMAKAARILSIVGLVLSAITAVVLILVFVVFGAATTTTINEIEDSLPESVTSDAFTYGDDPALDQLWDACEAGDGGACDELFFSSPVDSEYEEFGDTCGNRFDAGTVLCAEELPR